jgi:RNA polymerase sigma factor (sigma-70 family)
VPDPAKPHRLRTAADFAQHVPTHIPAMLRFAAAVTSFDEAADVVQDALLKAWSKRSVYDPAKGALEAWLLGIVYNQARGRFRRRAGVFHLYESDAVTAGPDGSHIDLRRAVDRLPKRQKAAVILYYYVDLSVPAVASIMQCSTGTVKSALSDARRSLGASLGDNYART